MPQRSRSRARPGQRVADGEAGPRDIAPGTVTAIKPQARDPERVNVYIDEQFAFGMGSQISLDMGLRLGEQLDAARIAALRAADDIGKATNAALNLLAMRPRSIREIRDRLRQKDYAPEAIDAAIEKLEGWNYVDDADFARFWVENRVTHRPRGRRLLAQELWQKGIDRETAAEALEDSDLDEHQAALDIARSKMRSYAGLERAVVYRRLGGLLGRRGFGYDIVKPVLDEVLGELDGADAATP
ncbi:MAG: regulatory protein RecX [Thermomicrobiales bacterium]